MRSRRVAITNLLLNGALIFAALAFFLLCRFPIIKPVLYVPAYTYDFGKVRPDSELQKTFTVQNMHPWPVVVTGIEGSCGCTKPFLNRNVPLRLKPLESVTATFTIQTPKKEGDFSQSIIITTSDMKSDTYISIKADIAN